MPLKSTPPGPASSDTVPPASPFDSIALPDSLFYMEKQAADYPYTPDGSRMWNEDTPWVDPLIAARLAPEPAPIPAPAYAVAA